MHILIVHAQIKTEFIEAFKAATKINADNSAKEPGIARFELLQQQDDPARFVLFEVYRDADAPAQTQGDRPLQIWFETVNDMFVTPRTRAFYTNHRSRPMPLTESSLGRFEFATAGRIVFGEGAVRDVPAAARALGRRALLRHRSLSRSRRPAARRTGSRRCRVRPVHRPRRAHARPHPRRALAMPTS